MSSVTHLVIFLCCLVYSSAEGQQDTTTPKDDSSRLLTEVGYLRYGDPFYIYPTVQDRRPQQPPNPTETNEIENTQEEGRKRPLFIFTTYDAPLNPQQLPSKGPYIEIRKKRDVETATPDESKVGILRRKRSYCRKCGGGGHGGYGGYGAYIPVTYAVYPVYTSYYPVYYGGGGGNKGCNTCGGGGGHGGGFSGSYSYSSSSSKSSSGSFGWGK